MDCDNESVASPRDQAPNFFVAQELLNREIPSGLLSPEPDPMPPVEPTYESGLNCVDDEEQPIPAPDFPPSFVKTCLRYQGHSRKLGTTRIYSREPCGEGYLQGVSQDECGASLEEDQEEQDAP